MRSDREALLLALLSLAVVALILSTDLESFPNYFLADEAIHSVQFEYLAENRWRAIYPPHEYLPAYFRNVFKYNLSTSVYGQGLAELVFGRSVVTVRATSVALCLSAAWALALLLRRAGLREWWVALPLSACVPTWLLHSRTGFEVTFTAAAFGWFLYFYLRYRQGEGWCILPAMLAGAGTFYGYSNGQGLMLLSALLLFLLDAPHHWRRRGWAAAGLLFALLLFLPYVRFRWQHPEMLGEHLRDVESYLHDPNLTRWDRVGRFLQFYFWGMSPKFWFLPNLEPIARHQAPGYGNVHFVLAPLILAGLAAAWRWRGPAVWLLLVAWCAGPVTASLAGVSSNRVLPMVFPLIAAAAAGWTLLHRPVRSPRLRSLSRWGGAALLLLLALSIQLNCRALGAIQTSHHGLFGLQWGAQAIYRESLPRHAARHPRARLIVTHIWSNNSDVFLPFFGWSPFATDPKRRQVELIAYGALVNEEPRLVRPEDIVVLTDTEYEELARDSAVASHRVLERLRGPDGSIHFYVVSITLRPDWKEVRRAAKAALLRPVTTTEQVCGGPAVVHLGGVDGSTAATLLGPGLPVTRGHADVPISLRIEFSAPRDLDEVNFHHWENGKVTLQARCFGADGHELSRYDHVADISSGDPQRESWKPAARGVHRVEITVTPPTLDVPHLRSIGLVGRPSP